MENDRYNDEQPVRILIVEDSPVQAEVLKHVLEENGFQVMSAHNGAHALEVLGSGYRPFLVISDVIMPEMDGYGLCRRIREDEKLNNMPVILLTSLSDIKDVIRGLECGASGFIAKPYGEANLISRIRQTRTNIALRQNAAADSSLRVFFSGETYVITADRTQILDFLLSTYEEAYLKNLELIRLDNELKLLNEQLEKKVEERTMTLEKRNEEIRMVSQQLMQAEKLATMGELASSIAHELNNPLATVSLRLESVLGKTLAASPHRRELEIIEQEVDRMANLVHNLLHFSRRGPQQISTVDVCEEIEKTLELIYYHLRRYRISIVRDYVSDVPQMHADRQQLRQLFLNLFTNATDAMPQGGTLAISVKHIFETNRISVEIADTGVGIPPEVLPKVTEPFFTTKPEGRGTGLGLAICRRVTEAHNGTLEILSDGIPGKGTRVIINLPAASRKNSSYLESGQA